MASFIVMNGTPYPILSKTDKPACKGDIHAKFSIFPIRLVENNGLKPSEIKIVESVIKENTEVIEEHWNKFFNNNK